MKKLLLSLLASALLVQFFAQQSFQFLMAVMLDLVLLTFTNADSIAIGFLDGGTFTHHFTQQL